MKAFLEFLSYEPETGAFRWIKSPSSRAPVGSIAGEIQSRGYRQIKLRGQRFYAHRLAWFFMTGAEPQHEIDHINGSRDDNRFANLRDVPRAVNVQNIRNVRGVFRTPSGRWRARVSVGGRDHNVAGSFATEGEAHQAYLSAKRVLHVGNTL